MSVIPLIPIFSKFNKLFFDNSLLINQKPIVTLRWSDNRLKTTAGIYKRKRVSGVLMSEIVLSKPILSNLPTNEIHSTLCHEMIHAWVDRVLKVNEIHGPNFQRKMKEINSLQDNFKISIKHSYPILRNDLKYKGVCQNCGEIFSYRKRMKNLACKKCCVRFFNGVWNKKCLIVFDL